jgi:hypothetical protein
MSDSEEDSVNPLVWLDLVSIELGGGMCYGPRSLSPVAFTSLSIL